MQNEYILLLNQMGFSKNEAKVYLALLKKNTSQATELVSLSGVPQKMIYYTLQKLMHRGLCSLVHGKVKKYKPTNPSIGIGKYIVQHEQQLEGAREMLKSLKAQYKNGKGEINPLEYIEVIQTQAQIVEKFYSLINKAKKEILAFTKGPYANKWENNNETIESVKKGLIVKSIYEVDDMNKQEFSKWVEMFAEAGEEIRISYEVPLKMIIFDEETVIIALRDKITAEPSLTSMIIEHQDMAKAFKITFNSIWKSSMTLEEFKNKEKKL